MCVWWETLPELGSRVTESSTPRGAEAVEGYGEEGGGRGSERAGWGGDMEKI